MEKREPLRALGTRWTALLQTGSNNVVERDDDDDNDYVTRRNRRTFLFLSFFLRVKYTSCGNVWNGSPCLRSPQAHSSSSSSAFGRGHQPRFTIIPPSPNSPNSSHQERTKGRKKETSFSLDSEAAAVIQRKEFLLRKDPVLFKSGEKTS